MRPSAPQVRTCLCTHAMSHGHKVGGAVTMGQVETGSSREGLGRQDETAEGTMAFGEMIVDHELRVCLGGAGRLLSNI
ncbi:hypothetical protein HYQ46_009085 [Verticillium longisporum]|nr:hypothetical protein HYQ46_009085 [Verticillium longisporum]